ncbi:response regulator [Croceicoccus sp. F390]|uniref:histidine kinase n=1 Tax=Croceicoccus esteveae TaxID=3075597 RepID=A0ABU2ZH56_9SPHN|nr:response regulator [Croceicoccus sp. F390]MDT0575932.1 response regulator [Croceicoccus sp. F390]
MAGTRKGWPVGIRRGSAVDTGAVIDTQKLGRIVEEAASEVYLFAPDNFQFLLVNKGARENLGYTLEEMRARTPWSIKPLIDQEQFMTLVEPLLAGTKSQLDFETRHERKDRTSYDVAVRLQLMQFDGEAVFYAAVLDLTELRRTQAALQDASRRLDAILSNTEMAVFMMDECQHCAFMNPAAEQLTGFTFEETQGRTLHEVVHHTYPDGRHFPIEECAIDRAFPENNQTRGEEVFVHKDGSFYPVAFTASPMKDEHGTTVGTIIEARNIAAELEARAAMDAFNQTLKDRVDQALQEREKIETQLIQAQKMEAVGQLTGGIAHDFNNLLQVIGGNLQLLQKDLADDDRKQRRVTNALAGVRRGAELAAQLLAFGRQQALDPKPVNMGGLVRRMDDMLRRTLGEAIEIETVISGGLWNCLIDAAQVENVILNLAINARDAMEGRGKLTIEVGNASLDEAYAAEHAEVSAGQYVMLAVTDTGSGIPNEILNRVFDPFFTTKRPGEGTGLGLSMVYGFVKQSHGHVKIYSEQGEGTTVRIYLPRTRREEDISIPEPVSAPHATGNQTILVVEDDDAVRATTIEMLSDLGYAVLEANNADSAIAIVNSGIKIDLLFTDVVMPGELRSPELARRAKQKLPALQVLFTSGYTQNAIVHAGRLDEGVELIAKPFKREHLAQKIHVLINRGKDAAAATLITASDESGQDGTSGAGAFRKLRVLVVEDEVLIRMILCEMLDDLEHEVVEAGSVSAARDCLCANEFDVVITDLGLPDGSGVDLVREIVESEKPIAVIVASGHDGLSALNDLPQAKRVRHLNKPYDDNGLKVSLSQI